MKARSTVAFAVVPITMLAAGCAQNGTLASGGLATSSINQQASKVDPACVTLATQIDTLRKAGAADNVAKAAAKKYRMKTADLAKADELNKANAQFQAKCATMPLPSNTASTAPPQKTPPNKATTAASLPPVPAQKTVTTAAVVPKTTATPTPQP